MGTIFDLWLLDALALTCALIAVVCDQRTRRIPNSLTGGTIVLAMVLWLFLALTRLDVGARQLELAALGAVSAFAVLGTLSCLELLGFGDTKLMTAIGLCVGFPMSLRVIVCTLLCGGLLALVQLTRAGRASSLVSALRQSGGLAALRIDQPAHAAHALPYALAIAAGTAWAVIARYVPEVAPL